jgi:hypothetical protein
MGFYPFRGPAEVVLPFPLWNEKVAAQSGTVASKLPFGSQGRVRVSSCSSPISGRTINS